MKLCVLGLDCAAPEIIFRDDRLVNIRRLMGRGVFGRLESVIPPITVPAWMCMTTSQDPGSLVTWTGGMLECGANPLIVRRCIDLLRDWREKFAKTGFDLQCDTNLLACVFGWKRLLSPEYGLPGIYMRLFVVAEKAGKGEADSTFSFEEVKKKMLLQVDSEITRLTKIQEMLEKNQTELLANQAQSHLVPAPAERYMKYETWLDHRIEKILDRLGRRYPWQRWKEE